MRDPPPGRRLKTLETAIELLDLLNEGDGYDLATIASELGLAKNTVHSHERTLESHDYIYEDDGRYYIGAGMLTLDGQVRHRHPSYQLIIQKINEVSDRTAERA